MKLQKQPFKPNLLPISLPDSDIIELLHLENSAITSISKFNTMLSRSVVQKQMIAIFALSESVLSTKIEGTQATLSDVIEQDITGHINTDTREVQNYYEALTVGQDLLKSLPISTRLFHQLHAILLNNARGENKSLGEYRKIQNFIGPTNRIEDATYIPPVASEINSLMSNLEEYINSDKPDSFGVLSKTAIIHAQFETIHPYLDGNGRLGRILIVLFLLSQRAINSTNFFLSTELERNKHQYYTLLNRVRSEEKPRWKEWIEFFIKAAKKQADNYIDKLEQIEALYEATLNEARKNNIRQDVVTLIFSKPIFNVKYVQNELQISYETARKHVKFLEDFDIVYGNDKERNRVYYFYSLLDILTSN